MGWARTPLWRRLAMTAEWRTISRAEKTATGWRCLVCCCSMAANAGWCSGVLESAPLMSQGFRMVGDPVDPGGDTVQRTRSASTIPGMSGHSRVASSPPAPPRPSPTPPAAWGLPSSGSGLADALAPSCAPHIAPPLMVETAGTSQPSPE